MADSFFGPFKSAEAAQKDLGTTGAFDMSEEDGDDGEFDTLESNPEHDPFERISVHEQEEKETSPRSNTPPVDFVVSPYAQYQVHGISNRGRDAATGQQPSRSAALHTQPEEIPRQAIEVEAFEVEETPSEAYLTYHSEVLRNLDILVENARRERGRASEGGEGGVHGSNCDRRSRTPKTRHQKRGPGPKNLGRVHVAV